jgi:hypothetical protein
MTADAEIEVARATNAIVVPLSALTFRAPGAQPRVRTSAAPRATPAATTSWGNTGTAETATLAAGSLAHVTLVEQGNLRPVPVRITLVSGGEAAIEPVRGSLPLGSQIAVSTTTAQQELEARGPGVPRL